MTALAEARAARRLIAAARVKAATARAQAEAQAASATDIVTKIAWLDMAMALTDLEVDLSGPMLATTQEKANAL